MWRDPGFGFLAGSGRQYERISGHATIDVQAPNRAEANEMVHRAVLQADPELSIVRGGDIFAKRTPPGTRSVA